MIRCFKCEEEIQSAMTDADETLTWEMPDGVLFSNGVRFGGGWNFGSSHYDAAMDGKHVEIVICDNCISKAKGTERMREVQTDRETKE